MFNKPQFRDFLKFRKSFDSDKFNLIVGNRNSFMISDVLPALREMTKDYPSPLPEVMKKDKRMPAIRNGRIEFQEFADYVMQVADDKNTYCDEERLKKLLARPDWRAYRVSDDPLVFNVNILYRVSEILAGI